MFSRWGEFAYQHRRVVPLVVVAVIILLYLTFGMRLSDRMSQEGWDDPNSDSTTAAAIETRTFGRDNNGDVILLFTTETGTIDESPEFGHIQEYLTNLLANHPDQIDHITSYFDKRVDRLISQDKRTAFAAIALKGNGDQTLKDFRAIEAQLAGASRMFPGVSTQIAGATAVADALDEGMSQDISRAEFYALPAVALLLLVVFGSLVAACMPLIVGGLSIVGSLGVLSILAGFTQVNVFAHSVVTLLGLGLAIDYGLFMVSRFREELNRGGGQDVRTAVRRATGTAGKTVVFSAAMVAVTLSGLLVFPQAFLKSVAYGAISAVGLAAVLSVTMLPALFSLLGHNIDKFMVRRPRWAGVTGVVAHALGRARQGGQAGRRSARGHGRSRSYSHSRAAAAAPAVASKGSKKLSETWWYRLPNWSMQHAVWVTCAIVGGLLLLALPIGGVEFGGINETYLPPTNQVRTAQSIFDREFPEFRTEPIKLVVTNADNDQLVQVYQQAAQVEGLTGRFTPTSATKDGITVLSAGIVDRAHNQSVVDQLRAIEPPPGVKVYIGGTPALEIESIEALFDKLPLMSFYIVLATFVLMALVFGSLVLPAKAVIMTLLSMGATIGLLTWMFVDGVGANLFGFTPGPLMSPVLVLIMAIIYGLSTDYEVFLVSRMVEAREHRAATDVAIKFGTAHTGGIISAAAIIMIVVCGAFGFSDIVMMKYIAFGMIFALLFDATIIRMMLVPAVMHLLQDDNWWAPPWVKSAAGALGHRVSRSQGQGRGQGQAGRPKRTPRPQSQPSQATRPRRLARSAQQGQPARPVRRPRTNIPKQDSRASVRIERDRASSSNQPGNQHPRREETIELATGNLPPQRFDKPRTTNPTSARRHFSPTTGRNTKQVPFTELLKRLESED
ncbi:MMPL family transporter [uncultured Corynebacterium sp.]|uniref:MMPL family transporter n=1 Tax=uncultured Corynebacterium sp. TaxID=159447 RepID=UPI0028EC657F|nr:MMPL family transporter [uncultured Corynebacterium sp.]